MTQEMQDKIRKVAEYDGWKQSYNWDMFTKELELLAKWINFERCDFTYHTDIAALYPVAKKVRAELLATGSPESSFAAAKIGFANNDFDIPALFQSVHDGIVLLENIKQHDTDKL